MSKFLFYGAAFLILRDDNKILLSKRHNTGHEDGNFGLVSGHIEEKETAQRAIIREAFEEAGITLREEDLDVVHVQHRNAGDRTYFDVYLRARAWSGDPINKEPAKCSALEWVAMDSLPDNTVNYVADVLQQIDAGVTYSNKGF
ncbi:MAG: hypothetical protein JWM46_691 [Candidatus Kaiserbacteria bacterium]|nr:hypothetical protein [Candidatus Kaiserbacteria bacterium]